MRAELRSARASGWRRRLGITIVLAIAAALHGFLFRISYVPGPRALIGDEVVYWSVAQSLAEGDAPEYSLSLWPLPYARFLAGLVSVFGPRRGAVEIVQTLMLLAVVLVIHDLAGAWTGSPKAAATAAAAALVYPPFLAFAHSFWPEVVHALVFLGALRILTRRPPAAGWLLAAGALLGLAVQAKSLLVPFLPVLLLLALGGVKGKAAIRRTAGRWALVGLGLALVLAPRLLGAPGTHLVESTATFNLWVGLNDRARKERVDPIAHKEFLAYEASAEAPRERNAVLRGKIRDKVRDEGVLTVLGRQLGRQYFRLFDKDSFLTAQLLAEAPGTAAEHPFRAALKASIRTASYFLYALLLSGAVLGIAVRPPRGKPGLRIALAFLVYNLAIFLVLHVKSRYRVQLMPFIFLYFGCAVAWLTARMGWNPAESELWKENLSPFRGTVAAAGVALLLFLAFGGPMI